MNTRTSVYSKSITIASCLFATVATVIRCILMTTYDATSGFYTNTTLQAFLVYPLIAFTAIAFVLPYIYIKEGNSPKKLAENRATSVISMILAGVFGGYIVWTFAKLVIPAVPSPALIDLLITENST